MPSALVYGARRQPEVTQPKGRENSEILGPPHRRGDPLRHRGRWKTSRKDLTGRGGATARRRGHRGTPARQLLGNAGAAGVPPGRATPPTTPGSPSGSASAERGYAAGPAPGPSASALSGRRARPPPAALPSASGRRGRAGPRLTEGEGRREVGAAWAVPHLVSPGGGPLSQTRCSPPIAAGK